MQEQNTPYSATNTFPLLVHPRRSPSIAKRKKRYFQVPLLLPIKSMHHKPKAAKAKRAPWIACQNCQKVSKSMPEEVAGLSRGLRKSFKVLRNLATQDKTYQKWLRRIEKCQDILELGENNKCFEHVKACQIVSENVSRHHFCHRIKKYAKTYQKPHAEYTSMSKKCQKVSKRINNIKT